MEFAILENDLTVAATAISALLLIHLFQLKLYAPFPWIVSYEILQFLPCLGAVVLNVDSVYYSRLFEYSCVPILIATLMVAHELVVRLYDKHPGLRVFNRQSLRVGVTVAILSLLPSVYSTHARWHDHDFACMLWVWMEAARVTEIGVVVYLSTLFFASKYHGAVFPRNIALFCLAIWSTALTDAIGSTLLSALRLHGIAISIMNILPLTQGILTGAALILFLQPELLVQSTTSLDTNIATRLSALQQIVQTCTRSLLR